MQPIEGRKDEGQPSNYFYGVDVTDKKAVQAEYARLKNRHRIITFVALGVMAFLALIVFDFVKVNYFRAKPLFSVSKKVENGKLYQGIGYKVLYCNNGERYVGSTLYSSCHEFEEHTFMETVYEKIIDYGDENGLIKRNNFEKLELTRALYDGENADGGWDYFIEADLTCKKGNDRCFYFKKEFYDPSKIYFYVRYDPYNDLQEIFTFKKDGAHVDELKANYTDKAKEYLKSTGIIADESAVRLFNIAFLDNYGKYKFRGTTYAETYLVEVNYLCYDNSNQCVVPQDDIDLDGDYSNYSFMMSMFIDENDNVALMGPKEYFDL